VAARNCPGGFSPGLACRVRLDDGKRLFVKAIDAMAWPGEAGAYRAEAAVTAALPETVPAPRLHGSFDDGRWIVLVFEDIDGREPSQPWSAAELRRVVGALESMAGTLTPSPIDVPAGYPRLGGWAGLAADAGCVAKLTSFFPWAARHLDRLISLEQCGLADAAAGDSLLHCDLYAHNILLTPERVVFVDWPHARVGNPLVDLVVLLSSAATDGVDPEAFISSGPIDGILAAHAGFLLAGGLSETWPGLEAITAMKLQLGGGALTWLHRRLQAAWP
jgi:hypothetical protein